VRHASHVGDKFVVNIDEASCTCRKWSITGIPCCHALSAMRFLNINGEDFISSWYMKSTITTTNPYSSTYYSAITATNPCTLGFYTVIPATITTINPCTTGLYTVCKNRENYLIN